MAEWSVCVCMGVFGVWCMSGVCMCVCECMYGVYGVCVWNCVCECMYGVYGVCVWNVVYCVSAVFMGVVCMECEVYV